MSSLRTLPLGLFLIAATSVSAQDASFALNGSAGIIDMPNALMLPDGETAWTFSGNGTMSSGTLTFQFLPNLETSVHFTTANDWTAPGASLFSQTLDLKYQALEENGMLPSLAIGFRGFLSNGPYTSEYLVASKSLGYGLNVTGGVGWGRLGSYNPVTTTGTRPAPSGTGVDFDHFFSGDAALFGGVEWDTPIRGLTLKAEYSSDAYSGEQAFGSFTHNSPFNFGVEYEPVRGVSIGGYYNYGSDIGFRVTLSGNPNRPIVSPDLGMGPVPVNPRPANYNSNGSWASSQLARDAIVGALFPVMESEGIIIEEARVSGDTFELYIRNNNMPLTTKAIGRIVRTLSVALPHSVDVFKITPVSGAFATTTVIVRRDDLEAQVERPDAASASWATTEFIDAPNSLGPDAWRRDVYPNFSWSLNPSVPINLSSGSVAASFDLMLNASATYQVSRALSFSGSLTQKLYGTDSGPAIPSVNPTPVRSNAGLYGNGGPSLDRLTADYLFKINPSTYARVSGGYLERMFAGVNSEVIWKPTSQNWGLGLEVSAVQQRAYNDMFGLEAYQAITAHGSLYWDTGFHGVEAQVDVGQYLAGDFGSTMTLSRRFSNGWEVSGYVTVTDMPFADFGDGNFSKGISVKIPLRWTMPFETRSTTGISLGTTGDGGAMLGISNRIYPVIRDYDMIDFNETWGAYWQ